MLPVTAGRHCPRRRRGGVFGRMRGCSHHYCTGLYPLLVWEWRSHGRLRGEDIQTIDTNVSEIVADDDWGHRHRLEDSAQAGVER